MRNYTVLYAESISRYATRPLRAATDDEAVRSAKAIVEVDLDFKDADSNNPVLQRIVHIEDDAGKTVAADIPLDGMLLLSDPANVRDAIAYALESLGAFKADWLANHGLNIVVEKLQAAYIEVGGAE